MAVQATAALSARRASHMPPKDWVTNAVQPSQSASGDEKMVIINIGGKKFETYEHTLDQFPNTLLGSIEKRKSYYDPVKDEYFFERHRSSFTAILYYYQSNGILERPLNVPEHIFLEEIEFFELTDVIQNRNEEEMKKHLDALEEENRVELPHNTVMKTIWVTFENPNSSNYAKGLAIWSLAIIVVSIMVFCIETLPSLDDSKDVITKTGNITVVKPGSFTNVNIFYGLNAFCTIWFTLELIIRFTVCPNKIQFVQTFLNILDLLSILPFYVTQALHGHAGSIGILRVMRVIRVARIFKLSRHSRGLYILGKTLHSSLNELLMLFLFLLMGVILFASAAYYAEYQKNKHFASIPHSFWWAVVTMTTVGYGDIVPQTLPGKLVGTLCALSGVLAIALPVPVIVSNFEYYYKEEMTRREREDKIASVKLGSAVASLSYRSLNQFIPKSPFLERKILERELRSAQSTPDPLRRRQEGFHHSPVPHKKNGSMKFGPHDALKEIDETSCADDFHGGKIKGAETKI